MQEKMERMNITIDADTREKLESLCDRNKLSMSAYLRMLVNQEHNRNEALLSGEVNSQIRERAN